VLTASTLLAVSAGRCTSFRGNYRKRYFSLAVARYEKDDETFPDITPHDLRHTPASLAIRSGANVKAVQRMLGHAKASMTLDVYADLFDDDLRCGCLTGRDATIVTRRRDA
jgi:integrase